MQAMVDVLVVDQQSFPRVKVCGDGLVPDYDKKDFGFSLGAGAMGFFSDHVGLRGDVRYFRTINNNDSSLDNGLNLDLGSFDFWRGSVGIVIR